MSEPAIFHPPRARGLGFHAVIVVALAATSVFSLIYGLEQQVGAYFMLLLILSLLLVAPLPLVLYRAYALSQGQYRLDRDGLRIRWGLRAEDIPMPEIEWVRRPSDLATHLPAPRLGWPGALLGRVNVADLGPVEYVASTTETLLLVATTRRIYAISPEDPQAFLNAYQRTFEMGSLAPLSSVSVRPAAYLSQVWSDRAAALLLGGGFLLMLLLFIGVSLAIPTRPTASLGFYPDGTPLPPVPSEQLLLLPILGGFIYLADLTSGLFFYRRANYRPIAYLVWSSAVVSALLLSLAALMNL